MISYLIFSTLSMGLLLLFYHTVLEQEKIHHFNRGFLIFALIFSLIVQFLPFGLFADTTLWTTSPTFSSIETIQPNPGQSATYSQSSQIESGAPAGLSFSLNDLVFWSLLLIYFGVTSALFIRFLRLIHMIQLKSNRNPVRLYEGATVVLHNEKTVPYTFLKTIFVNRKHFQSGAITKDILRHELAHVRQMHTLDILFIELLKIVMWFNPMLYLYKKAMMLNHEFLADQAVLSTGTPLTTYQQLLFDALQLRAPHGLSSNFSFSITKKRFTMMTRSHSRLRSAIKMMLPAPLIIVLVLLFGCESKSPNSADVPPAQDEIAIQITEGDVIRLNGKEVNIEALNTYLSELPEPPEVVHLNVSHKATFGLITDVQQVLRMNDALRIRYKASDRDPATTNELEYDQLTEEFLDSVGVYLNLPPTDIQSRESVYNNLIQTYDSLKIKMDQFPDAPPPPPLPPSPENRIDLEQEDIDIKRPPLPPPPVKTRNLMNIRIDHTGTIYMNDAPVSVDEILPRLTDFIANPNGDSNLSEGPEFAVIGIKTDRHTPYDIYLDALDEVMLVYDQLRNSAAMERYGVTYTSLSDGSDQKQAINSEVPKRISIAVPRQ